MGKLRHLVIDCSVNKPCFFWQGLFKESWDASAICFKMPIVFDASRQVSGTTLSASFSAAKYLCVVFFFFLARWADCISLFFPSLCSHLYCFECMLAEFGFKGLCGQAFCTSSLICCWEPNGFTWTPFKLSNPSYRAVKLSSKLSAVMASSFWAFCRWRVMSSSVK